MNDCILSGSQTIGGGEYDKLHCSGSLKINGNIKCNEMHISGSCKTTGSVDCKEDIRVSGSFSADGDLKADSLEASGSFSVNSYEGEKLSCSGSFKCEKDIKVKKAETSGSFKCRGIEADSLDMSGKIIAEGQINSENIELKLSGFSNSRSESIVGSLIRIRAHLAARVFGLSASSMRTDTIEGDDVEIDCVEANIVRGENVKIGKNCKIKRLEYKKSADVDPRAQVGETVKI